MPDRRHRHEIAKPRLWRAVSGAIRSAMAAHPDIEIPPERMASIVKRVCGQALAHEVRAAMAVENGSDPATVAVIPSILRTEGGRHLAPAPAYPGKATDMADT